MLAAPFVAAALWLSLVAVIFMAFLAFGDWLANQERKRRREILREHRRHMDSLEPKRWIRP
jgi:hypothetical protein